MEEIHIGMLIQEKKFEYMCQLKHNQHLRMWKAAKKRYVEFEVAFSPRLVELDGCCNVLFSVFVYACG